MRNVLKLMKYVVARDGCCRARRFIASRSFRSRSVYLSFLNGERGLKGPLIEFHSSVMRVRLCNERIIPFHC